MAAPVVALAVLAFVGAVLTASRPPSWLGWCPPWLLAAAGAGLAAVGTWMVQPWATRRRARADVDHAALGELGRYLGWSTRLPLLSEMDPLEMRVHLAIALPADPATTSDAVTGLDSRLPSWVERDIAEEVRSWLGRATAEGGFLVVVGDSSTGKTRLLYELLAEQLGDWAVLAPDLGAGAGLVNTLADATVKLPRTGLVVWLDELQRFLPGPYLSAGAAGLSAATVRKLLDAPTPVVLVGALWPEHVRELRAEDIDPATGRRGPRYPGAADVLAGNRHHEVNVHSFNQDERRRAARLAGSDPRLADAVAEQWFGVTEVLAGAPEVIRRYQQATADQRAVVHAAADALRLGVLPPLSEDLLRAAARTYLDHIEPDDRWYPPARDALAGRSRGGLAPLLPVPDPARRRNLGWTLADYLLQHLTRHRAAVVPPAATWQALTQHASSPADLNRLGTSAHNRGLGSVAEPLYRAAATAGDPDASHGLFNLLWEQGREADREQVLRDRIAAGDPGARDTLAHFLLGRQGREAEAEQVLRDAIAAGDPETSARVWLARRLETEPGRQAEAEQLWRDAVAAGDPDARDRLASLLREQDREEEAEQALREGIAAGDSTVRRGLASLLWKQGRRADAEQVWRDALAASNHYGYWELARLLWEQGREADAEQVWRDAVTAGDRHGYWELARLLREQGRLAEVEQVLRDAIAAGDPFAREMLATALRQQGREAEVEQVLRDGIAVGDPFVRGPLVRLLGQQGREAEVEQVWRDVIAAGGRGAYVYVQLARLLGQQGREAEAEQVLREGIAAGDPDAGDSVVVAGDPDARDWLASLLREQGREAEAEQVWRDAVTAGDHDAHVQLARLLREQGREAEAEQALREGIAAGAPDARDWLASLLREQGREAEVEQVWRDAVAAGDPDTRDRLASLLREQDREEEATRVEQCKLEPEDLQPRV
ncbi:tetratricopeptide repeat protein [Micromonospora kangleipakensis]|uniref:Tetratricopeptide repeat protein n=1 Tax=Micromonospora kangleipakensis TaxID=1077942 RepID=A0A4Q8B664_9ACTN|nr:tetratricopeptide repeat protein [Micromonospora kangleipakensis]RZU72838.1 tetratricopeptide repeat protein [Micromonospora kangleipakensis]